ncbi:unnamed protein product [Acanthoscelides obtectus]|uniref:RBR-type E3 ubiquitin transferase n=1 Tax=Acanthoscelides obtectus TaxID=200917 RepID=A0A9P0QGD9_ACAOB|nr:unnamed protein product [Acanthoscelides obtectus]CAK1682135.1 Probable E3 ubiquitin-protein ligase RNF144A [Acanthoscelides obtectus]
MKMSAATIHGLGDEGCAQMMCKRCKHVFCWCCLASLDVSTFGCSLVDTSYLRICWEKYSD